MSTVVQEEIFGPVLTVLNFRTPKEAIKIANQSRYGLASCKAKVVWEVRACLLRNHL